MQKCKFSLKIAKKCANLVKRMQKNPTQIWSRYRKKHEKYHLKIAKKYTSLKGGKLCQKIAKHSQNSSKNPEKYSNFIKR